MPREEINKRLSRDLLRIESISFLLCVSVAIIVHVCTVYEIEIEWSIPELSLPEYITCDLFEYAKYVFYAIGVILVVVKTVISLNVLLSPSDS